MHRTKDRSWSGARSGRTTTTQNTNTQATQSQSSENASSLQAASTTRSKVGSRPCDTFADGRKLGWPDGRAAPNWAAPISGRWRAQSRKTDRSHTIGQACRGLHGATLLNGQHVGGGHALWLDVLAYLTYLLPLAVLIGFAVFLSTVTRNSAAAIVGTVIFSLAWQGIAVLPGIKQAQNWLFPKQFDAWEALYGKAGDSIGRAALMCAIYALAPLIAGWLIFLRRDVAGA